MNNNKKFKIMINALKETVGENGAGMILAIVLDSLKNYMKGMESREVRTMEVKFNNYFSTKYDFDKGGYVND